MALQLHNTATDAWWHPQHGIDLIIDLAIHSANLCLNSVHADGHAGKTTLWNNSHVVVLIHSLNGNTGAPSINCYARLTLQ